MVGKKLMEIGPYGPICRDYVGKPKDAIKYLMRAKEGECAQALYREDIGFIDFVWGEVTDAKKHKGYGLAHIIDKHGEDIKALGFRIEDFIPITIMFGNPNITKASRDRLVFEAKSFRFVVSLVDKNNKKKTWLLTSFSIDKQKKPR